MPKTAMILLPGDEEEAAEQMAAALAGRRLKKVGPNVLIAVPLDRLVAALTLEEVRHAG